MPSTFAGITYSAIKHLSSNGKLHENVIQIAISVIDLKLPSLSMTFSVFSEIEKGNGGDINISLRGPAAIYRIGYDTCFSLSYHFLSNLPKRFPLCHQFHLLIKKRLNATLIKKVFLINSILLSTLIRP